MIATAPIQAKPAGADTQGHDSYAVGTWTPATPGDDYTVTVNAIDANNATVPASNCRDGDERATPLHSVRITRPANNSLFGYYATTDKLNMAGTATVDR